MDIGIISVTKQGDVLAQGLCEKLGARLYSKNTTLDFKFQQVTKTLMEECEALIFIASTGIAVRAIAPYLKGKDKDPAVLVVDCCGNFVISLLSGHLGGANYLTEKVASLLKAQPIITTATDNLGLVAPDMIAKDNGLLIEDLKKAKLIAAKLIEGENIGFYDEKQTIALPKGYVDIHEKCEYCICVGSALNYEEAKDKYILRLGRKDIVLGIGCKKDYDSEKMLTNVKRILKENNLDINCVATIATVEVKAEEKAILDLAKNLGCELKIYKLSEIAQVQHRYKGSDFVEKTIGVRAVCEPSVELSGAEIIIDKINCEGMTLCIGTMGER